MKSEYEDVRSNWWQKEKKRADSAVAKAIEQKNIAKANCKMAIDKTCCSDDLS